MYSQTVYSYERRTNHKRSFWKWQCVWQRAPDTLPTWEQMFIILRRQIFSSGAKVITESNVMEVYYNYTSLHDPINKEQIYLSIIISMCYR